MSYAELADWLGGEPAPATLDRLHAEGDLERLSSDRLRITNPALLRAGAQAFPVPMLVITMMMLVVAIRDPRRDS